MSYQFRRGLGAIEEAATRKSGGSFSNFAPRLRWREDGEKRFVLVLTPIEEVPTISLHEWIPVGKGEKANGETYTRWADFISRRDPAIGEDSDELEDRLERDAKNKSIGVVVELEPITEQVGGREKVVSFTVKTSDYTKRGENEGDAEIEMTQPDIAFVVESPITLWGAIGSLDQSRGPISDIPVEIIRRGKDQNTRYDLFPLEVPVDLSPIVDHLDGLSYLNDEMEEVITKIEAADGDMLAAAQVVADAMLSKRLNELADGERYEELVSPLKLEDMPKPFGGKKKSAPKKDRPARATRRQATVKAEPEATAEPAPAPAAEPSRDDKFAALKARVAAEGR
jgi:hypothetical protein